MSLSVRAFSSKLAAAIQTRLTQALTHNFEQVWIHQIA
jgi:hypothetical protein